MKRFLILLFLSYASSDKLDLTYLPPPGSQYAGGRPDDIQTPLEYPKNFYSTTVRPQTTYGQKVPHSDDYQATIGINRLVPSRRQESFVHQGSQAPFNYQTSHTIPSTTVSYAFTQTTTHAPTENFETTISPFNPVTGVPYKGLFNIPSQESGQVYQGSNNQFPPNIPGHQSNFNSFTDQSTPGSLSEFLGSSTPSLNDQLYKGKIRPGQSPFQQNLQPSDNRQGPLQQIQYPRNQSLVEGYIGQPGLIPSTSAPSLSSYSYPAINSEQRFTTLSPGSSQTSIFNQSPNPYRPDIKIVPDTKYSTFDGQIPKQNYPEYSSTSIRPKQQFPKASSTVSTAGFGRRPSIAGESVHSGNIRPGKIDTNYVSRERPQAEADRNAYILNYKNVITPEGFEYSFDTSNGIHADENGTAIDGVKAEGSYSYTGDDGKVYTVVYTADENGFQPYGDHLPTPPPIPEAIQRLIEMAKREKEAGIYHDGSYDEDKYGHKKYQGTKGRHQQNSDRTTSSNADMPDQEGYYYPTHQSSKKEFNKSRSSLKKPQVGDSRTDFKGFGALKEQNENDQIVDYKYKKPINEESFLRPVDRESNLAENFQNKQMFDNKNSRRPLTDVNQNKGDYLSNKNAESESFRKRPFQNTPYEKDDQDTIQDDGLDGVVDNYTTFNKNTSQRPSSQQRLQAEQNKAYAVQQPDPRFNYNRENIVRRPLTGTRKDGKQTFTYELDNEKQPLNEYSTRRPINQQESIDKSLQNPEYYSGYDFKNNDKDSNIKEKINRLPAKYPFETTESNEDLESFSEVPARLEPSNIHKMTVETNTDKIISTRGRPSRPGFKVDENVTEDNQGTIDDISSNDGVQRDSYTTPTYQTTKDRYEVSTDYQPQNNQHLFTKGPQNLVTKYSQSRDRFQTPQPSYENVDDVDVKYDQSLRSKPIFPPRFDIQSKNENTKNAFNSTGYQYIPPRNGFDFNEGSSYYRMGPGTESSISKRPSQQRTYYENENANIKPFMTPNVSRGENKNIETENEEEIRSNSEKLPNQYQYDVNQKGKNYEQYTTPDQFYSDEVSSTTRPSSQAPLRPSFQSTRKPQYYQQYSTTPSYNTTPGRTPQIFQNNYDGKYTETQKPFDVTSSTTTAPSRRPMYYGTTPKEINIPGQKNVYYTETNSNQNRPINNIVSSSTPSPSQGPLYEETNPERTSTNQYQTTYQPARPTSPSYDGITVPRLPTTSPSGIIRMSPAGTENIFENHIPSTTYRPKYKITSNAETSQQPGLQVDAFGRPINNLEGHHQYASDNEGVSPADNQNLRTQSSIQQNLNGIREPSSSQNPAQRYQTSTERIIGEDFSGPKQQQRFDPKLGYYY